MQNKFLFGIVLCLLLPISLSLSAINYLPGPGNDVSGEGNNLRERNFFYHNNTDDQHWYGTDKWAVRFNFAEVYPTYSTSQFIISKAKIYFPMQPSVPPQVTAALYSDFHNYPSTQLTSQTVSLNAHWTEFVFPVSVTASVVWLVLTCNTYQAGPFVSASRGGGEHSFYLNTNTPVQYFQNFATAGINSELLFTISGRFELSGLDLELANFELGPEISPAQEVRPAFTVINNSAQTINSGKILLNITSPDTTFAVQDTIFLAMELAPYAELHTGFNDPLYAQYSYRLPNNPAQFKVRAQLTSEYAQADTSFNNVVIRYYNAFNLPLPIKLAENFFTFEQAPNPLSLQDMVTMQDLKVINYFPMVADTFYVLGARQRFDWYGLTGLPETVIGGDSLICGFVPSSYAQQFSSAAEDLSGQMTFLQQNDVNITASVPHNILTVRLSLSNRGTAIFNNGIEPTLAYQSRFFAALCHKTDLFGANRYVFDRWGAFADTIGSALALGTSWLKQFTVLVSDIDSVSLWQNYDLVYWLQNTTDKQIWYANVIPLLHYVPYTGNAEEIVPSPYGRIIFAPNPLRKGSVLRLTSEKQLDGKLEYSLYNVRGQLVQSGLTSWAKGTANVSIGSEHSAGVYLLRLQYKDKQANDKSVIKTKKIMLYP